MSLSPLQSGAPEQVVLLDPETDRATGTMEKLEAHLEGRYHSAISVLIVDGEGRQLLQRRAAAKYHAPGLWSNACCSHPRLDESAADAAARRLREELGVTTPLTPMGVVRYRARVPTRPATQAVAPGADHLTEFEHVALFVGRYSGELDPDPAEVEAAGWWDGREIREAIAAGATTPWFGLYADLFGTDLGRLEAGPDGESRIRDFGFHDLG
ncbi:isopentenyl-diphosphate Delta-isomerase [Propylenella binzhouense]|uniref:isopentenyl-diphosphate Delta-isomerase n=1 Tax=Propylenella binzhouense TaxID=2555902 RepID=A0A964WVE4_9HYPH|nr:isopentenyl-diphosphate Delta-isomerase [Propylenella binzhouense]MYZ49968.1 isopentenyl-diphosphate Delta-isomerase [Propylenella binzhouense]